MVEAILHKEIDKLKKDLAEKDDKIHALELISSESIAQSSAGHSDSVNGHTQHDLEAGLTKLRHELFSEPHTVDCGHTFCYQCLKQWLEIRKQCPTCRKTLTRRPMLSFTVQHQVEIYLAHLAPKSESENYRKRVETAKDTTDRWENIFHKERKTTYLEDIEDDTRRCPSCNWELVGQECVNCGEIYHDAPEEDSEEGESVNTDHENGEESGDDDSESQNSFVVDDDVVEYSDASQDVHDEIENLDDEDSEEDYGARSRKRKRTRRSRASPVVVNLGSSSEGSEVDNDYEEAEEESDGYNDFQSPPPQTQKRNKKHKKSKMSNRRVIALDDSDEESMPEANPANGNSGSDVNDSQENGNKARQTFHISSDEDDTSDDDQEQALVALTQGSSPGISASTANIEENTSSKKNKKKKKSKKHSHSHKEQHHKKDKGKARA
ncbi:hypothetical protein INT43_002199 [Umbelopsis isabellina]|uniref:RING-type domain-containing protein n=1 Tax=Mortierella isabellina TaxID=91625 RepID=A0A8H7Q655_MORIS|nr:hypothetical protein INT43_002199 [Umbelopsis isabellina]